MIGDILTSIIGGAILGRLARFILPGKQNISIITTVLAGIIAAFVGTLIARLFGFDHTAGIDWWKRYRAARARDRRGFLRGAAVPAQGRAGKSRPPITPNSGM